MAGGGGSMEGGEPEFQVAPMIDVLLTILVFFMTITSMEVLRVDQDIKLPVAPDAQKKEKKMGEVIINVRWDPANKKAKYSMDQKDYFKIGDMTEPLKQAVDYAKANLKEGWSPDVRMVIRADQSTPAYEIQRVISAGAEAGLSSMAFSAASKE